MKYIFYAFLGVIAVLCVMILGIYTLDPTTQPIMTVNTSSHHIVVLVQSSKDPFWKFFRDSAESEAKKQGLLVEFVEVPAFDSEAAATAVERAVLSDADAIALQPVNGQRTAAVMDYARKSGIAILTFENDAFTLEGVPTVGSNSYLIGTTMAKMAAEATNGKANVAILINDRQSQDTRYKSLKLQGMLEGFASHKQVKISGIHSVDNSLFGVDKLTRDVLYNHPEVNLIICTDERGTPAVAKALVDTGEVGRVQVVGYGNMEETMRYVDRSVIYATICTDGKAIGAKVISQLNRVLSKKSISETSNTPIYTYTSKNLDEYYKRYPDLKPDQPSN